MMALPLALLPLAAAGLAAAAEAALEAAAGSAVAAEAALEAAGGFLPLVGSTANLPMRPVKREATFVHECMRCNFSLLRSVCL